MKAPTKRFGTAVFLMSVLLFPSIALAQRASRGQTYVFGAIGDLSDPREFLTGVGIGYERLLFKGLGVGAEFQVFAAGFEEYRGVTVSFNGSYHFKNLTESRKLVPFATGGYTAMAGCCNVEGFNLGGGATYWLTPGKGLRAEFRDHVFYGFTPTPQKREVRIGLSF